MPDHLPYTIHVGDCLHELQTLPDESVHCCITSPPYFGLRDYGMASQIGLEQTPAEFVARLVDVFREVRRVLRDDGTLWLNIGDSYASTAPGTRNAPQPKGSKENPEQWGNFRPDLRDHGIKPKDLIGIPWRLAFALQDDGWYLRQDIIWHKPNPMPESVRDRCTKAHEYLFLLSKSPRYHFDQDAIAEPLAPASVARLGQGGWDDQHGSDRVPGKTNGAMKAVGGRRSKRNSFARETKSSAGTHGQKAQHRPDRPDIDYSATRNKRSVWTVPTAGFKGAHFATFPPDLIRPCVLAGAPRGGLVLDPFGGAGTTALVAMQEGRRSVLLELNPEYASIARHRLAAAWLEGAAQLDIFHDTKEPA
ncbi:TPA: site-specific DNA-methyltransferase [Pseudomonas aeruginosa]|uniref:DNA-methyltransferase n=1 Tax=Pseudomonas aeruginosa TaxID=287 RepID=UPI002952BA16|nr:site-specific DNA-methyltransferase [Pseudomonas aeruginosa]MDV8060136.1 site-specific DNA-methyltransferase [Pseudomonas aeruginosa]MDV8087913.1 site-specific DNA-methyltransferase [Pseudomonas aeruginosa]HEJ5463716.1 site-specific DNA-methyltransferase [Pseudomonas aeruginosa]